MSRPNDFPPKVRRALMFRAQFVCSFPGCNRVTVGPSADSSGEYVTSGDAGHIHAASPGGPRYLVTMSDEERSSVENGIWLCKNHHALVDGDESTHTAEQLRRWRADREKEAAADHAAGRTPIGRRLGPDLFAIGPDIVALGELVGSSGTSWRFRLDEFVFGEVRTLTRFGEDFSSRTYLDRFVLVESFGEGRSLAAAPTWSRSSESLVVSVEVCPPAPRKRAQDLGSGLALGDDGDTFVKNGQIARVAGLEALPQKIRTCLSYQKGESVIYPDFGSRVAEYVALYKDSPWLDRLLTLELIRLASIPYRDRFAGKDRDSTPLQCVDRVISFQLAPGSPTDQWWPASVELDVVGLGRWQHDLKIFVGKHPPDPPPRPPSADKANMSLVPPKGEAP